MNRHQRRAQDSLLRRTPMRKVPMPSHNDDPDIQAYAEAFAQLPGVAMMQSELAAMLGCSVDEADVSMLSPREKFLFERVTDSLSGQAWFHQMHFFPDGIPTMPVKNGIMAMLAEFMFLKRAQGMIQGPGGTVLGPLGSPGRIIKPH
jgi:hypothetical protein